MFSLFCPHISHERDASSSILVEEITNASRVGETFVNVLALA
jgi:hypothetical protein